MKKKLLTATLAIAVTLCVGLGVAGCGNNPDTADDLWNYQRVYAAAVDLGFEGTLDELIAQLSGADGKDGKDGVGIADIYLNEKGELIIELTEGDPVNLGAIKGETGAAGKSAYEIWLEAGHTGSEEDFLNWLKGEGNTHEHTYSEGWVVGMAPTCTSIGYNVRTCDDCGEKDYQFLEALGHVVDEHGYARLEGWAHSYTCAHCSEYRYERHTANEEGKCDECGREVYGD